MSKLVHTAEIGQDTLPAPRIPDEAPSVSFGINLGKEFDYVDFDYGKFQRLADDLRMSDGDTSALTINIGREATKGLIKGYFVGTTNTIELMVKPKSIKKINKRLSHEMKHASDFAYGELDQTGVDVRYRIGQKALHAAVPVLPLMLAGEVYQLFGGPLAEYATTPLELAAGLLYGSAMWGYQFHPDEVRARGFAEFHEQPVISFAKKL